MTYADVSFATNGLSHASAAGLTMLRVRGRVWSALGL